jgi:2'-5' RNA ligase
MKDLFLQSYLINLFLKYYKNMSFTSYINWLNEAQGRHLEFACAMLKAEIPRWQEKHLSMIQEKDVYDNEEHEYGLEKDPHITLLYGIHEDEIDINDAYKQFNKIHPIKLIVNNIGVFENEDYDVVKYDIQVTEELLKYRKYFLQFPHTNKFPNYEPHITISYVKPGTGKKYVKNINQFKVTFKTGIYSSPHYKKQLFEL